MTFDPVDHVDSLFWTKGRLATYTKWPFTADDGICTAERMAAAGFYLVGGDDDDDTAKCFVCNKELNGWEATDDPWQEHADRCKQCPFILLNKPDETTWTIDDFYQFMKTYNVEKWTRKTTGALENIESQTQSMTKQIPKIYKQERKSRKVVK